MMKLTTQILSLFILILVLGSCQGDELADEIYEIEIYLTDDPLNAEEVNIEILGVVLIGMDDSEPIELNTISGIYNLLDFQGDVDTLIASGNYDLSTIREIRLILGENNTIKIDGQLYPLSIPSGAESGLKIKINKDLIGSSLVSLLIDFDACESVKEINGEYKLSPVIHFKGDRNIRSLDTEYVALLDSCYTMVFPIEGKDINGEVIKIESREELTQLILDEAISGVVYPIVIEEEDGKERKINNHAQAERWIDTCQRGEDIAYIDMPELFAAIDSCFTIEYPVSFILEDGSEYEVNSDEALLLVENAIEIVFPIYLNDGDDTKRINNENQLEAQLKNCEKEEDAEIIDMPELFAAIDSCYTIEYPVAFILEDGSEYEVNSDEALLLVENAIEIVFPIYLNDGDDTKRINNENQLEAQLKNCENEEEEEEEEYDDFSEVLEKLLNCYELAFPLSVELADSSYNEVMKLEDLYDLVNEDKVVRFVFDITITAFNGTEHIVNNENQLNGLLRNCKSEEAESELLERALACYSLIFPINVEIESGDKITIQNAEQLQELFDTNANFEIKFPISLKDTDGNEIKIPNKKKLNELSMDC